MVAHINALKQRDGIICDLCGIIFTKKFDYFSVKFTKVAVDCTVGQSGIVSTDDRFLDLDVCDPCYDNLKTKILDVINKREKKGSWSSVSV